MALENHGGRPIRVLLVLMGCLALAPAGCEERRPTVPTPVGTGAAATAEALRTNFHPGSSPHAADVATRIAAALAAVPADYVPRTRHLDEGGKPLYTNRLILESSPYLHQHAHNPVDWYPWGEEAFARAKAEGKPILLSVGYATCHWCHVMEEESFEDLEIAEVMNRDFVCIKVDREERPDVDGVYMTAVQMLTGRGGWPMTVFLTPGLEPFFGGTYFPPRGMPGRGRPGFLDLLNQMKAEYDGDPAAVATKAADIARKIAASSTLPAGDLMPGIGLSDSVAATLSGSFDPVWGGFGRAPKFPRTSTLTFLLRHYWRTRSPRSLEMVSHTLEKMAAGGMHDQIGGGFHRYSTDVRWFAPHFEKMLYDNGLMAVIYLEGYQASGREEFAGVARRILDYLVRDMRDPGGAFYSATDADSEGEEGTFFLWTPEEIRAVVAGPKAEGVLRAYGMTGAANFEGKWIPHLPAPAEGATRALVAEANEALYAVRKGRIPPLRDEKIQSGWNGLAIRGFARAAFVLNEPRYAAVAAEAAQYVLDKLRAPDGRLLHSITHGRVGGNAFLDDYAYFISGLIELFEATGDGKWLRAALELQAQQDRYFLDAIRGTYYLAPSDGETLVARDTPDYDGALPTGNSVSVENLVRLEALTGDAAWGSRAIGVLTGFAGALSRRPGALPRMLAAMEMALAPPKEVIIVAPAGATPADPDLEKLASVLRRSFVPHRVVALTTEGAALDALRTVMPPADGKLAIGGKPTAFVCERGACDLPTSDSAVLRRQLGLDAGPALIRAPSP